MTIILETNRLILRQLTMDDTMDWYSILSDKETMQYYPQPFDLDKTKDWIVWNLNNYRRYNFGLWAVILKETGTFIGDCGMTMQKIHGTMRPEIGYHIDRHFWRKGYASEAASASLAWAFANTSFDEISSYQKYTNIPSRRVAEKMGMTLREEYADPVNTKTSVYSITRSEFSVR